MVHNTPELITNTGIQLSGLANINTSLSTHNLIYEILNLENGRYYIGQHITDNPYDGYMGSGTLINKAVEKYGLSSFIKTIRYDFETFEEMDAKERELVQLSDCYPNNPLSYNLREGGSNGKLTEHARKLIGEKSSINNSGENNPMFGEQLSNHMTPEAYTAMVDKIVAANKNRKNLPTYGQWLAKMSEVTSGENNPMYGHSCTEFMTEEEIALWQQHMSDSMKGEKNPMYGKSSWDKMNDEQKEVRKAKFRASMKGKNKGRKMMINPDGKKAFAKPADFQKYLDQGYVFMDKNFILPTSLQT